MEKPLRTALLILLAASTASGALACTAFRGARLYDSGTAALERGDSHTAIAELEEAADHVPQASEIQNHLGLAYAQAGRPDDALQAFRRAVALDCENQAAQQNLDVFEAAAASSEQGPRP